MTLAYAQHGVWLEATYIFSMLIGRGEIFHR